MIMHILRIQMGSDDDLIFVTPHLPCRFQADGMGFFRRDLAGFEALESMVGHIPTQLAKAALGSHHVPIRVLFGAVDGADEHPSVGFLIIFCICQNPVQIIVQILGIGGLVRVFGVVDHIFEVALYRPESCCSDNATSFADCLRGRNRF